MKVYYKTQFLIEVNNQSEAEEFIESYMNRINDYNRTIKDQYYDLSERILKIKSRRPIESFETYEMYVKETYPKLVSDFEQLGQEYYKERFIGCYFHNNDENYSGFYIKSEEFKDARETVPLSALFLNCVSKRIYPKFFKIEE